MLDVYHNLINITVELELKVLRIRYGLLLFDIELTPIHISVFCHLQIRLDGSEWSFPFPIDKEEIMDITVRHADGRRQSIRLDVRGYEDGSRFIAIFQLGSCRGPYRYLEIQLLKPCTSFY